MGRNEEAKLLDRTCLMTFNGPAKNHAANLLALSEARYVNDYSDDGDSTTEARFRDSQVKFGTARHDQYEES
jgi:hypothetical protein